MIGARLLKPVRIGISSYQTFAAGTRRTYAIAAITPITTTAVTIMSWEKEFET